MTLLQIFLILSVLAFIGYIVYLGIVLRHYPDKELVADVKLLKEEYLSLKKELVEIRKAQDLLHKQAKLLIMEIEGLKDGTARR